MSHFFWGAYPYLCILSFVAVPILRMAYRPFGFSTRASGLFNRDYLGAASLFLHWGLFLLLVGHMAGFLGGLMGMNGSITFFFWSGLLGGLCALVGSVLALLRRYMVAEVKALSQWDDYIVHWFLIGIIGLGLYQVIVDRIFGVAYTASAWIGSLASLSPQPELMESASLISKIHVVLALTFFAVFPFTKLVHLWTYPVNYFTRPYVSMRTDRFVKQRRWEFALTSDKSWMIYGMACVLLFFAVGSALLGHADRAGGTEAATWVSEGDGVSELTGYPLYVSQCARCHGLDGRGDGPGADSPTFAQPPKDFVAGDYHYISTTSGFASDADLEHTIRTGLTVAGMPAFDALSDAQVNSLVRVLAGFWENRPDPGQTILVPAKPALADVEQGKRLYNSLCAVCHGTTGHGDGPGGGAVPDRKGRPIMPRALADGALKAGKAPEQIYLRIRTGIPGVMPAMGAGLPPNEIWSIVHYLQESILPHDVVSR